jgi:deferrochelatase/peroxidase EfeB
VSSDPRRINAFSYADDAHGYKCPLGAHIRRANPRDSPGFFDGRLSNRHRIVRRGRAYGAPLAAGALEDDGVDRGLIFVCFQADIWRQFETIQSLWIDDGDPFGLGADKDFLIGQPEGDADKMTIPGHPPFFLRPQPRFVTVRGGEYLYRPSLNALRWLASGGAG